MKSFRKATDPQLNIDTASVILERVFEQTQVEPNTIPLDVLESYSNYRRERFALQRTVLIVIIVLFLMLPFLFIAPDFGLTSTSETNGMNPTYYATVDTFMPVEQVTATIDGQSVPVNETDSHVYSIEPTMNGKLKVTVTLINRQTVTQSVHVKHVDRDVPVYESNDIDEKYVYLYLSDKGSGIDYENIYAIDAEGNRIKPVSCDKKTGRVAFAYPKTVLNVYVPDYADNTLQLIVSLK